MPDLAPVTSDIVAPDPATDPALAAANQIAPEAYADQPMVEALQVTSTWHVPGAALESVADRVANEIVRAEPSVDTLVPVGQRDIATAHPYENLMSRNNIVPSGPGSVEDHMPYA